MSQDDDFGLDERPVSIQLGELRGEINQLKRRVAELEKSAQTPRLSEMVYGGAPPPDNAKDIQPREWTPGHGPTCNCPQC